MYRNDIWIGRTRLGDPWPPGSDSTAGSGADGSPDGTGEQLKGVFLDGIRQLNYLRDDFAPNDTGSQSAAGTSL